MLIKIRDEVILFMKTLKNKKQITISYLNKVLGTRF